MKKLSNKILDFLENHGGPFYNSNDVEICLSRSETVLACSNVPGFVEQDLFKLEYLFQHQPVAAFINQFSVDRVADLDKIDPKELERLYHFGKVQLWCHIYPSEKYLIFTKWKTIFSSLMKIWNTSSVHH